MLGQVPGDEKDQLIESIEVGDLSMGTDDKAVDNLDQVAVPQSPHGTPVRCFTNSWFLTDLGLFHVYFTVVGPVPEEPKYRIPLTRRQAEGILQKITDMVKLIEEELR